MRETRPAVTRKRTIKYCVPLSPLGASPSVEFTSTRWREALASGFAGLLIISAMCFLFFYSKKPVNIPWFSIRACIWLLGLSVFICYFTLLTLRRFVLAYRTYGDRYLLYIDRLDLMSVKGQVRFSIPRIKVTGAFVTSAGTIRILCNNFVIGINSIKSSSGRILAKKLAEIWGITVSMISSVRNFYNTVLRRPPYNMRHSEIYLLWLSGKSTSEYIKDG